jgi:hypothetical protein
MTKQQPNEKIRLFASVSLVRIYVSEELSHMADVCEMEESLTTAFLQLNAHLERVNRHLNSKFASILKAIGNGLGSAVDSNGHPINPAIYHTLGQRSPRKANKAQS